MLSDRSRRVAAPSSRARANGSLGLSWVRRRGRGDDTSMRSGFRRREGTARFGPALRSTVAASAFPYGYTLTIWTSGAVLAHTRGAPSTVDALLYMAGAVAGFLAVAVAAFRGFRIRTDPGPTTFSLWDAAHFGSIGGAIGVAVLVAHLVHARPAWAIDGFLATSVYLTGTALQLAVGRAFFRETEERATPS